MVDNNAKAILQLLKKSGNDICADCSCQNPLWACYNIGIFICGQCAEIHQGLGVGVSKVKHITLDLWEDSQVIRMHEVGNQSAKEKYERLVAPCYRIPVRGDPICLIEEWIKGKYVREEFCIPGKQRFMCRYLEDHLLKKAKEYPKYYPRKFTLSEEDDLLKYYVDEDKDAKGVIKISEVSISFAPEKMEKRNSMQLSFPRHGPTTRHIYLCHQNPETIVTWYNAIRCYQLHHYQIAFPFASTQELVSMLSEDFKEGWLWKTGPRPGDAYRKRWFTLDRRKLMYHDDPLAAYPKGQVMLGEEGYSCNVGLPTGFKEHGHPFTLTTPERTYCLAAETEHDRSFWIHAIQTAIILPLTPLDSKDSNITVKKKFAKGKFTTW